MTANELRLRNYVMLRDTKEIVIVCAITKRKVGFHAPNERPNAHLRYRKFSEIEGVSIYDHWPKIDELCSELSWMDGVDDEKSYSYNDSTHGGWISGLRYIHELQNLHYALTGEELEIEI